MPMGAISNNRPVSAGANTVTFRWKDDRVKSGDRQKTMRPGTDEFIRRFPIHVPPDGVHRIRHCGLMASAARKANVAKIRTLLGPEQPRQEPPSDAGIVPLTRREPCPERGAPTRIVEISRRGQTPATHPRAAKEPGPHDESHISTYYAVGIVKIVGAQK